MWVAAADPSGLDPENVKPGWLGLAVVLGLALGVTVLVRSFAKHTRRAAQLWDGEERSQAPETGQDADRSTS